MSRGSTQASARDDARRGFDAQGSGTLEIGRLTWLGLSVSLIGWVLLIAVTAMADALTLRFARSPVFHDDLVAIAKCLIASGFALAAIGTLQAGFGALDRFFGAVLLRSGARAVEPQPVPYDAGPAPSVELSRRPYRTFADGSVEVDTILGTRRFATMGDARDFI